MFSTQKIVSEIKSLSAQIESSISETGYDRPWWHIYPLMEKERHLISRHLIIVQANIACTRLKLLVGKIIRSCTTRFSG